MNPLGRGFFDRCVHEVARELIGCRIGVGETAGVIVETEAYEASDPACHAYVGRTARNEVLFGPPGRAYVYLSYGIHSLLNAVAEPEGSAAAVLIRALEPTEGVALMRQRRRRNARAGASATRFKLEELCSGPGKLTEALGVGLSLNGADLLAPPFRVSARDPAWGGRKVVAAPRIGITKAADLPWRYCAAGSRYVSRPWPGPAAVERAAYG
ncbi:MAG TPA: DNA-3-methyladenine glycosylase [Solirubrobacterales bacterium]|nr:DNA-3-methyladenine glycosylase [Solirubrobacterales bacterium]